MPRSAVRCPSLRRATRRQRKDRPPRLCQEDSRPPWRTDQTKERNESCGKLERLLVPARDGSLLFDTWRDARFRCGREIPAQFLHAVALCLLCGFCVFGGCSIIRKERSELGFLF